jgi:hypothetical protein
MTSRQELIREVRRLALHLYVAMAMRSVINPPRNTDEAVKRLCLHAREYYEGKGGLPVYVVVRRDGAKQVFYVDETPAELLVGAQGMLRDAIDNVMFRDNWRCRTTLTTLEHSCSDCVVASNARVVAGVCTLRRGDKYCIYDFAVYIYFDDTT